MMGSRLAAEANRLYWETETPVADIAARFDLSRRALYETVRPAPIAAVCPECGGTLHFENRLARRTGNAACADCGAHVELGSAAVETDRPNPPTRRRDDGRSSARAERSDDARSSERRARAVLLSGAALAGVAVGGVAAWLARRRD